MTDHVEWRSCCILERVLDGVADGDQSADGHGARQDHLAQFDRFFRDVASGETDAKTARGQRRGRPEGRPPYLLGGRAPKGI